MKADFIHGYRPGAAMFYVSTTNFVGQERMVTEEDRSSWSPNWQRREREFERVIAKDKDLKVLSNRMFFVWDGNHRLQAWWEFINQTHPLDYDWHYAVRAMVISTKNDVTSILMAMHDINKATENSHVRTNLVHTLHRMQKVGTLPPSSFKALLTPEELKSAIEQAESKGAKSWYTIPRAKFLEYIHSVCSLR